VIQIKSQEYILLDVVTWLIAGRSKQNLEGTIYMEMRRYRSSLRSTVPLTNTWIHWDKECVKEYITLNNE
jgi:hypothetical protein